MKTITNTEVYAELASARDLIDALHTRIFDLNLRISREEDNPEGRLLAATLREIQRSIVDTSRGLSDTALCYRD